MGYTTEFDGHFNLNKPLTIAHKNYLDQFAETRRMVRNGPAAELMEDSARRAVGLKVGDCGEFFVGGKGFAGQERDSSILDYNTPPPEQPGLWCQWVPTEDGTGIVWNGAEKFYYYVEWLEYLIANFLKPWGYVLSGEVTWQGEDPTDIGKIVVKKNVVRALKGRIKYGAV